jgi:hypothetical protein
VISNAGANDAASNDDYIRGRTHLNQFSRGCIYGFDPATAGKLAPQALESTGDPT